MEKDLREKICDIISKMFDNEDEYGIFPTTIAYDELEELVKEKQILAIGWAYGDVCSNLDKGKDPREENVPDILVKAKEALIFS